MLSTVHVQNPSGNFSAICALQPHCRLLQQYITTAILFIVVSATVIDHIEVLLNPGIFTFIKVGTVAYPLVLCFTFSSCKYTSAMNDYGAA